MGELGLSLPHHRLINMHAIRDKERATSTSIIH